MHRLLTDLAYFFQSQPATTPLKDDVPDFIGIGVPQGGTTWLYEILRARDEVFFPGRKEVEWFSKYFYRSADWYQGCFRPGRGKIRGEITPAYCALSARQVEIVHSYLPDVKIFIVLRDPIERAWSAARRLVGWRYDDLRAASVDDFEAILEREDVRARTDYPAMLANWHAVYPTEQIKVFFFHQIINEPERVLHGLFEFLGLPSDSAFDEEALRRKVNANPTCTMPPAIEELLVSRYEDDIASLHERFGARVDPWLERLDAIAAS